MYVGNRLRLQIRTWSPIARYRISAQFRLPATSTALFATVEEVTDRWSTEVVEQLDPKFKSPVELLTDSQLELDPHLTIRLFKKSTTYKVLLTSRAIPVGSLRVGFEV